MNAFTRHVGGGQLSNIFVYVQLRARLARLESKIPENTLLLLSNDPKFDSVDMCSNQMSRLTTAGHKSWLMRVTFQSWCNKCIQNQSAQQFEIPKNCFFKVITHVPPSFSSIHIACPTLGWPFLPPHLHIFLRQSPLFWATH